MHRNELTGEQADRPESTRPMGRHELTREQIDDFRKMLKNEERAAATIKKYMADVECFFCWLDGRGITKEAATQWKEQLLAKGYAPATVNAKLSAVNDLFVFLGRGECRVKFLKVQRKVFRDPSRELTRGEYARLCQTAHQLGRGRLGLLIETICATGIRVSEVKYITVEAAQRGRADVSLKGKIRTILLPNKLGRKLLKYARKQKIASGEIFVTKSGKGISRRQIWREMKQLCSHAGVERSKVFPHNLRHLFAATFYRAYKDVVRLADILGHSSIETTRIYLMATSEEHVQQMEGLGLLT